MRRQISAEIPFPVKPSLTNRAGVPILKHVFHIMVRSLSTYAFKPRSILVAQIFTWNGGIFMFVLFRGVPCFLVSFKSIFIFCTKLKFGKVKFCGNLNHFFLWWKFKGIIHLLKKHMLLELPFIMIIYFCISPH